jgi:thiamine-phosphate pyrophosphorylase
MHMTSTHRIIDANANRAREALRVMEDVARFALDDQSLCRSLKELRHDLRAALDALPGGAGLSIASRDTEGDVGTGVSTPSEHSRAGLREVALAASHRLTESLRSIEECTKTLPTGAIHPASTFESLRYLAYDLEKRLISALGAGRENFTGWRLCVLLTESLCVHHDWRTVARLSLEAGADCVQLREKNLSDRELLSRAKELVELAEPYAASVVINNRPDIALLAGATGVHVGQDDLPIAEIRALAGDDLLVGASTSTIEEAHAAAAAGADSCGVGPMFPTSTKHKDSISGPTYLLEYLTCDAPLPPPLAIGGITPDNLGKLVTAAGGKHFGVAVSSCVCSAREPDTVVKAILAAFTHPLQETPCPSRSSEPTSTTA